MALAGRLEVGRGPAPPPVQDCVLPWVVQMGTLPTSSLPQGHFPPLFVPGKRLSMHHLQKFCSEPSGTEQGLEFQGLSPGLSLTS